MNRPIIEIAAPVMEGLARIDIKDAQRSDMLHLDHEEVVETLAIGDEALLDLILENCGSDGVEILKSAADAGVGINLDGHDVEADVLMRSLGRLEANGNTL
ncbi:hypothetical protein [Bosea sp. RAC05]|uniref:hypothetical protein n=1 Tax=Bosea sp. RAC05 TaxID=1842539 RepID=UPI00083E4016|nr:hypothetical protein [Bosea sp. RAC05]AOG03014.1 hypothetical protein BSY19_4852 [Bosea sp. RAC05]